MFSKYWVISFHIFSGVVSVAIWWVSVSSRIANFILKTRLFSNIWQLATFCVNAHNGVFIWAWISYSKRYSCTSQWYRLAYYYIIISIKERDVSQNVSALQEIILLFLYSLSFFNQVLKYGVQVRCSLVVIEENRRGQTGWIGNKNK